MQAASTDPAPHKYNRAPIDESLAVQACRKADFECSSEGAKSHYAAILQNIVNPYLSCRLLGIRCIRQS